MMRALRKTLGRNFHNMKGWSTKRKIVVIESDDWGTIRMPSLETREYLLKTGLDVRMCSFCQNDSLESDDDLSSLFDLLLSHKLRDGKYPVITANTIVANPDFEKIKESGYQEYHYELFPETQKKYPNHIGAFDLWKYGIEIGIFHPQLHGREHVNVHRWMDYLKADSEEVKFIFDQNMFEVSTFVSNEKRKSCLAAFDFEEKVEEDSYKFIIKDAQVQFEKLFGYRSQSFIAPNYIWGKQLEKDLKDNGIEFLQGSRAQIYPEGEKNGKRIAKHYIGERNEYGQIYLVRNCVFEPTTARLVSITECMDQVQSSFFWNKPAIIGTHRLNFIGSINKNNQEKNLLLFDELLTTIIKKWPDVEFMTSDALGNLIKNNGKD